MVLADIILLAFVTVFSTGALYIITAYIVYKIKNRGKVKPYMKKSLVKTVTTMFQKPVKQVNKIEQRKNIPEQNLAYAYKEQRPIIYVQSSESDLMYNDFYVKQNLHTPYVNKPKLKRPAPKREIRFN